jgi:hypothetical protein
LRPFFANLAVKSFFAAGKKPLTAKAAKKIREDREANLVELADKTKGRLRAGLCS